MNDLRLIFRYGKPYRRDLWAAAGLIFIECIFEMVIPVLMSTLVDEGVPSHNMAIILRQGGLMALCAVLALITGLLYARYAARFANGFAAELRLAEYAAVQKFDFANLDHFSSASLVTRMTTDATVLLNAINAGLRPFVRSPVMLAMGLGMAFLLSPKLTIVFLITTPILTILLTLIVCKVGPLYGRQQSAVDHLNSRIQESLTAIRAIKAFVRGDYENEQFNAVNTELSDASTETFRYAVLNLPAFQTIMYTAIICIMWFGGGFILQGDMSVGQLTAFLSYVLQVLNSVMMFSGAFLQMTRSLASARRIREVLTEQPDLANAADPLETVPNGQIDFEGVSFKYNAAAQKSALSDITLHIPAGATVGIIGGTGSAKTTLVQLIPRLYDATEGTVRVGGMDVRDYDLDALRHQVAMVLQKNVLFSGTIAENLRWGDPNATDEEVREAAHLACADEFVDGFPKGYDTWIEQGGSNVSGGQKQRLCIARALLRRPKILILDDSTSAVDTKTDAKIRAGLASYLPNTTKLIIAQRISSVQDADRIIVMEGGRIAQIGNHDELLKTSEIYRETFTSQNKMSAEGEENAGDVSGNTATAADNTEASATQAQTQEGGEAHE